MRRFCAWRKSKNMEMQTLLEQVVKMNASDLHLLVGVPPIARVDGALSPLANYEQLQKQTVEELIFSLLTPIQKEFLLTNKELDFSFSFGAGVYGNLGRFRVNAYFQRGYLSAEFRFLPPKIRTIEELSLPKILHAFTNLRQGFVLVTGPTGHGKTTTLAALIDEVNNTRPTHILTIEDPIEYTYINGKSIVSQREMGNDTYSWAKALRSALREDPDVVLIGEMRDPETIASAITIAETGHLVFSTLHTNSASQSIDRIVDVFPPHQQNQIRIQLASTLEGVISQRLLPTLIGGRLPAVELLLVNDAVRTNIREGKSHLIDNIIKTSGELGMISLENDLARLVKDGKVTKDVALAFSFRPEELMRLLS